MTERDACWTKRGCDEEMLSRCPHNTPGEPCPADCYFAACSRPAHVVATDVTILLNPELDYDVAAKAICRFCENFLKNGPARSERIEGLPRYGNPNRFLL